MRILFDEQIFANQKYGGISRYYTELVKALGTEKGVTAKILSPLCTNYYAKGIPSSFRIGIPFPAITGTGRCIRYFNKRYSNRIINRFKPDILHQTYYPNRESMRRPGVRIVTTVYDMIHELFPKDFPVSDKISELKLRAVENADLVICISENTRQDLIRIIGIDHDKTTVIHLGVDHSKLLPMPAYQTPHKPYLLYVGLRGAYKNFQRVLKAYARNPDFMDHFDLICFGGGRLTHSEKTLMAKLNIPISKIVLISGDDELLSRLYQHANVFLYPSLYEGFGIPPLEAMMQSCPVISSNVASLPEVLGNAVEYFDPRDTDALVNAITRVVNSLGRIKELKSLGLIQAKKFTWNQCAEQTLNAYKELF